jgi:penicillin-binding protein 1A
MALPIWGKFFSKIYADKKLNVSKADFVRPKNLDPNLEMDCSKDNADMVPQTSGSDNPFDNL